MNIKIVAPSLALVLLTGACSDIMPGFSVGPDRRAANAVSPVDDPFQQALVDGYKLNADSEFTQGNYRTAQMYYLKAIGASNNENVVMEHLPAWTVPTGLRSQGLHGADERSAKKMRENLAPWVLDNRKSAPQAAALQQLKYDCWIEQMSEQQYEQADACAPSMQMAKVTPAPAPAPEPEPVAMRCDQNPDGYNEDGTLCKVSVIEFAYDRYDLTRSGAQEADIQTLAQQTAAIDQIMRQVKSIKPARIDVMGRTDSTGSDAYNYGLSECRSQAVVAELRARGLPASVKTRIVPMGKTDLIVPTVNNVREVRNRVVMVAYQTDENAPSAAQAQIKPVTDSFGCGTTARHPSPSLQ